MAVGGMASVYLAETREIETVAGLTHPHILPLHDSGVIEDKPYYVMPYVDGESLRQRITRQQRLSLEEALRFATEIASALGYAHEQGLIHRDVKPENILLSNGIALVTD
jgi:serine/threonine-protein kinase